MTPTKEKRLNPAKVQTHTVNASAILSGLWTFSHWLGLPSSFFIL
jgi:hypothetical protein